MTSPCSSLRDTVFSLPILDTHAHMRQWPDLPQSMTAYTFFSSLANLRASWVAAGALSRQEFRKGHLFSDWPSLSGAIDLVKTAAYYRILLDGLRSLFDMEFEELDEGLLGELGKRLIEANQDPGWYRTVLRDRSGFIVNCQDTPGEIDLSLFACVSRMDSYVLFGCKGYRDRIVQKHGPNSASTLSSLVDCLKEDLQSATDSGAVAIKSNVCWTRTLQFEQVDDETAESALNKCLKCEPDANAAKVLGDYMMDQIAGLCSENDVPLQIHTGPAGGIDHIVQHGNPLNLNSLIVRNPNTRFCIFHAGGPFARECCSLAVQCPNVYLDLCGVFGRESLKQILDEWVEYVPHGKLMWGTDVHMVEEAFAVSQSFRRALSEFLEYRVQQGYFPVAAAESFARGILAENARRVLRLYGR